LWISNGLKIKIYPRIGISEDKNSTPEHIITSSTVDELDGDNLQKDDLSGNAAKKLRSFFTDDATVILGSCLTGAEGGIAEAMHNLGIKIIAPKTATSFKSIDTTNKDGSLQFEVDFKDGGDALRILQ